MKVGSLKRRDQSTFGAIDYALMATGNCFGVYAAGMSVGQAGVAWWFVYAVIAGNLFSLLVRRLFGNTRLVQVDSILYASATICAVLSSQSLNALLPGDGIPPDVITLGWLCWMLAFGSALTWRDRTLLFQAVPTIALFGLVGCYDTFSAAPFLFFGFLLCLATLLGRSHSREMLRQAVESGYFNRAEAPNTPSEYPEQSPELYEDIKRGPWRWLAGPEWALMSGLAIVLVSLLGAPIVRTVVQPLSGVIHVNPPKGMVHALRNPVPNPTSNYEVGRGPNYDVNRSPVVLYRAKMDRIRYLRTETFDVYNGHGWTSSYNGSLQENDDSPNEIAKREMAEASRHRYHIRIEAEYGMTSLPLPAEVESLSGQVMEVSIRQDGGGTIRQVQPSLVDVNAVESLVEPRDAQRELPRQMIPLLETTNLTPAVKKFADDAVKGKTTDADKATAILQAIGRQCKYDLSASAVPSGSDAAEFFLTSSRVGYCDLFATAMVMCARAENIPARYALGYLPDPGTGSDGSTAILDRDYHAWAELYFKHVGWVVYDATSAATTVRQHSDISAAFWSDVLPSVMNALVGIGAVILAAILLWPRLRKRRAGRTHRAEIEREYIYFTREILRATHRRRQPSETPSEYLEAVRGYLNGAGGAAENLTDRFISALYAPGQLGDESVHQIRAEVREFKKLIRSSRNGRNNEKALG